MNYIKRLEAENARRQARLDFVSMELDNIYLYLHSDKFNAPDPALADDLDGYVNVQDVLNRLNPIRREVLRDV